MIFLWVVVALLGVALFVVTALGRHVFGARRRSVGRWTSPPLTGAQGRITDERLTGINAQRHALDPESTDQLCLPQLGRYERPDADDDTWKPDQPLSTDHD
ncbi:hypothetical protein [Amycolatopsis sp. GM8]|uniref:hypothetical protein n=1 Tax=Amycolatopsis sp. GM8 TaxID=2896530 RepID=UPI001F36A056|nr:hypothetical protein [Amycolatopsis sp. GM8]